MTVFGLMTVLALGCVLALSDAQDGTAAPPIKVEGKPREPVSAQPTGPWAPQQVKLDGNSPTYTYLYPHHFQPPEDGNYTAAVKGVANVTFKVEVAAIATRPGAKPEKETIHVTPKTEKGNLFATFAAKKGTQYDVMVSTTKAIPKGTKVDTQFIMLSGAGSKVRPVVTDLPLEQLFPKGGPKDPFIPMVARLMERHLANLKDKDKNELDLAFEKVLKRNPKMTKDRMQTFVKNYNELPEKVRRDHFVEPTPGPGRPAKAAMTKEDVKKAVTTAHPDLLKVIPFKKVIVTPEFKKVEKGNPILRRKIEQLQALKVPAGGLSLLITPMLVKFDPATPSDGCDAVAQPGDKLTLVGKFFSTKATEDEIWLSKQSKGPDGGVTQERIIPDSATTTQLKFTVPHYEKGTWVVYVKTPSGMSTNKDLKLTIGTGPPPGPPPRIRSITPNYEPGSTVTLQTDDPLTGAIGDMGKDPVITMVATNDNPNEVKGALVITTGKTTGYNTCKVTFPTDMVAGSYDICVAGDYAGSIPNMSGPFTYTVVPGRYQIQFEEMKCVHVCHEHWVTCVGNFDWNVDAKLATVWHSDFDDTRWSLASDKHPFKGDGGENTTDRYKDSEANIFKEVPGNVKGYQSVRFGLALATQLYDWQDDSEAKALADDIKTVKDTAGAMVTAMYAPVGGILCAIADKIAEIIPIAAKLFGFTKPVPIWTYRSFDPPHYYATVDGSPLGEEQAPQTGPYRKAWTFAELQQMYPGECRPPMTKPDGKPNPGYTIKFGFGSFDDWHNSLYGDHHTFPSMGDIAREGDWTLTYRIRRAAVGTDVTAP
jgi:hypothetical protein